MGGVASEAVDKLRAMGQDVPPGIQKLADASRGASGALSTLGEDVKATALGFISGQAVISAFRQAYESVVNFVQSSIEAWSEQEAATTKLNAALRAQGTLTPDLSQSYQELSSRFQDTTVYGDELTQQMEALLVQVGEVGPDQMKRALQASADLAAGLGIDLNTATLLVGKAFAGETATLTRYGIIIDQNALKTRGASAVLDEISAKFGGQAAAAADTYRGRLEQLSNAWGDYKETIGQAIAQDPLLEQAVRALTERTKEMRDAKGAEVGAWTEWLRIMPGVGQAAADVTRLLEAQADEANRAARAIADGHRAAEQNVERLKAIFDTSENAAHRAVLSGKEQRAIEADLAAGYEKIREAAQKAEAEGVAKFTDAMQELNSVGQGWRGTLDTINGTVAQAITYYLNAGVSQAALATAYGLTAAQVKAVASALKEEADMATLAHNIEASATANSLKQYQAWETQIHGAADRVAKSILDGDAQIEKAHADLAAFTEKTTTQTTADQIGKIWQVADAQKQAFKGTQDQALAYYQAIDQLATEEETALRQSADAAAKAADATGRFGDANARAAQQVGVFVGQMIASNEQLDAFYAQYALHSNVGTPGAGSSVGMPAAGSSLAFAAAGAAAATWKVPTFAAGVDNFSGGRAIVGEAGPELLDLPPGSSVTPLSKVAAGGSQVVVHNTFNIVDTEANIARRVSDSIMRSILSGRRLGA